jgi:hypothetical protein
MYAKKRYRPRRWTWFNGQLYSLKHTSKTVGSEVPVTTGNTIIYKNVLRRVLTPALLISIHFNTFIKIKLS